MSSSLSTPQRLPELRVPLLSQPDGITCGSTCIAMVHEAFCNRRGHRRELSIENLRDLGGTNERVGTTDVEMARGLTALGIHHQRHLGEGPAALTVIREALANRDLAVLRCSVGGMKHWILGVRLSQDGSFVIHDPAGGEYLLSEKRAASYLAPRNWDYFIVPSNQKPPRVAWRDLHTIPQGFMLHAEGLLSSKGVLPFPGRFIHGFEGNKALVMGNTVVAVGLGENDPCGPMAVVHPEFRGFGYGRMTMVAVGARRAPGRSAAPGAVRVR